MIPTYRGEAHHYGVALRDFAWHTNQGRRFFTLSNLPLATVEEVRAALRRDKEVVSRASIARGKEGCGRP